MVVRKLTTNFSSGELDRGLHGRSELPLYQNGAARVRNMRPLPGGGVRRRGGLIMATEILLTDYQHNEWIFNADQTYQLLFSHTRVDIHDGVNGFLLQTITGAPWNNTMLRSLSIYCQGDFAFICHPDLAIQQIRRTGPSSFVLEPYKFDRDSFGGSVMVHQPYYRYARSNMPLTVTSTTGYTSGHGYSANVTRADLSTPDDYFVPAHVGSIITVGDGQFLIDGYIDARRVTSVCQSPHVHVPLTENPVTVQAGITTAYVYDPFHNFFVGDEVILMNILPLGMATYDDLNGPETLTGFDDSGYYYAYAPTGPTVPSPATGGGPNVKFYAGRFRTNEWSEAMYSTARGWPHCVSGFQTRLILGGGRSTPNRVNFSRIEGPFNFDVGTGADDDAISVGMSGRRTPTVLSVVGAQHVQIFTSEGEYYIPTLDNSAALTPTTIAIRPQTFYGISAGLPAVEFDGATLFVSKNGGHLRQLVFAQDGYTAADLSFIAHHLLPSPKWLAVQMEDSDQAAATALIVNSDGTIANLTMMRSEKIAAWALHNTQGQFLSACAVNDRAFFIVIRTIGGVNRTFLEKLDRVRTLDCSTYGSYLGPSGPNYLWGGFTQFANTTAHFVVDGYRDIGEWPVNGAGQVVIDSPASVLEGGFPFAIELQTLPPEMVLTNGPTVGEPRRVVSTTLKVIDSYAIKVRNNKVVQVIGHSDLGAAPALNGNVFVTLLGWDEFGLVDITQYGNAPLTVLALNLELEF